MKNLSLNSLLGRAFNSDRHPARALGRRVGHTSLVLCFQLKETNALARIKLPGKRYWLQTICAVGVALASSVRAPGQTAPAYAWTNIASESGGVGIADGTGSAARFGDPSGVAVDSAGNVFVADTGNHTIRKVTPTGVVTTLAGSAGASGRADGTGSAARFGDPSGVAVDSAGNVFVADTGNHTIRRVTPAGVVTTLAGLAWLEGNADGTGSHARFDHPRGVAVDSAGNVFVADTGNYTIRRVTPAGVVTTLAGSAGAFGRADGTGSAARF